MSIHNSQYQKLLSKFSNASEALKLLREYRPYFEKIPSIRRAADSIVPIPLPTVKIRRTIEGIKSGLLDSPFERKSLTCDLAFLMCDPDWQIKNGEEIFMYIHRPGEDFSHLLTRWRHTQVVLGGEYIWDMPIGYEHMLSEGSDKKYPLFILFEETPLRIAKGLKGARLPHVTLSVEADLSEQPSLEPSALSLTPIEAFSHPGRAETHETE